MAHRRGQKHLGARRHSSSSSVVTDQSPRTLCSFGPASLFTVVLSSPWLLMLPGEENAVTLSVKIMKMTVVITAVIS